MDLKSLWRFSFSTNTKWMASKSFSFSGESWPRLWQPPCLQCRLAAAWQLTVHWWNISHQNDPCNWQRQRQIQKQSEWCLNVSKIENIYLNCWIVVGALVVHYTIHWQMKHLKIWTPGQRWSKVRSPHVVSHCPRCRFDPWDWIWNASSVINFIMCVATATRPFTMRLFLHLHVFKRQIWWTQEGEKVNSDLTEIESEC